jgi:hypothetical protein
MTISLHYIIRLLNRTFLCSCHRYKRPGIDFVLQKFHCFLFDTCFVVTRIYRPSIKFTVRIPVIPAEQINVEEVELTRRNTGSQTTQTGEGSVL